MSTRDEVPSRRFRDLPGTVWWTAGAVVVLLLAVSSRYGFHRDELYFVVAGRRLDWGFVDQPPLVPLVARIAETVAGTSPTALRILPALAIGAVVVLTASMARQFGGGRTAQIFAGIGGGFAGFALAVGHLLSTATFEYLLWTVAAWTLVRILDGADPRWWLGLGAVIGVGLQNKHLIALFAAAVLVSLALTGARQALATRWPWLGAAVAAVIAVPNVIWQVANDFPQLEMARAIADRSDGPVAFVLQQIGLLSIALAVPAGAGLWRLLRDPRLERFRSIGLAFVLLFGFFFATSGKAYYVAPMYPVLLAAGAPWVEELGGRARRILAGSTVVGIAIGLFIALPLLPPSSMSSLDATGELAETVGWPELIDLVASVYEQVPPYQRDDVAIFTASYGEAGAIDVLGPASGLPKASSGHNNYWLWGPPEDHGPVIGVGWIGGAMEMICPSARRVATITNPYDVENEEFGGPIFLCLDPVRQLADVWDELKHYN